MAFLSVQHINKQYGDYKANNDISIAIPKGCIYGLLGPNGAGKTTLIRIITQILMADSGSITFGGEPLKLQHMGRIGYMPEERGLYKKMKVGEHLLYLARLKGLSKEGARSAITAWMEKFDIADWWNKKIEELSKGMQQKIQFIATVVHKPELLILDEPFSGLDPINTNLIKNEIYELKQNGTTIIFSTHRMEQVEEVCERVALISKGQKVLEGDVAELKQRFKERKYHVGYEGELHSELPPKFKMLERHDHRLVVGVEEDDQSTELLRFLVNSNVRVTAFQEILPSINEIFIKQVTEA